MRTPKEAFIVSGHANAFRSIVANPSFEIACEYALLHLQSEMLPNLLPGKVADPYTGMDSNAQMHGAARVLAILSSIADPIEEPKKPVRETLHYENKPHANRSTSSTAPSSTDIH